MALTISDSLKDKILDGFLNNTAGGTFDTGFLRIYSGAPPGANLAATGDLLAEVTLPADAFAAAASGTSAKLGTWEDTSANTGGTAGYFRMVKSGDTNVADGTEDRIEGTVTLTSGGGDLELDNTNITQTQVVTIGAFTLSL